LNIAAYAPQLTRCVISIAGFVQGQWTGALGFSQRLVRRGSMGKSIFKLAYKLNRHWRPGHRASWQVYAADSNNLFAYPHLNTVIDSNFPYFCRLDLEAMAHYFAAMPDIDISFSLSHITVPTLVLTGDSDPIVPPTQSHLIAGKIPWADLVVMKGVGHLPFFENPAEYQQVIGQWLNQQLTN
jgi:pimeloyl-ACP methyl ester carboxylesterase